MHRDRFRRVSMWMITVKLTREPSHKTRVARIAFRAQPRLEALRSSGWCSRDSVRRSTLEHYTRLSLKVIRAADTERLVTKLAL
jgi:hypothetical protein